MAQSKKNIVDSILNLANRFKVTDEQRIDPDWLSYKIDQVRADLIVKQYVQTQQIDPVWVNPPFALTLTPTNYPDDLSITCTGPVSKVTIPQIISLPSIEGNLDLGIVSLISMCGQNKCYTFKRMSMWGYIPSDHVYSKFKYYDRQTQVLYLNDDVTKLLFTGVLLHPEDGYLKNSSPVASGSLVNGTSYTVREAQIIYAGTVYQPGATFTAGATATFTTNNGLVYLTTQAAAVTDTDPYPASGEMIRQIEIEILTKELGIEKGQLTDIRNDSEQDSSKVQAL